jgi:integrase
MMQPGWSINMRRTKQRATRFPGVMAVGDRTYRIRFRSPDPKTGRLREVDRVVQADSAGDAAKVRDRLRDTRREPRRVRIRLKDYAASWLSGARKTLKASTLDRYATTLDVHILPALGEHYLDAITHQDVVAWRDGQTAAPATINSRLRVLKTLLASATVDLDLSKDPSRGVKALREAGSFDDEHGALLTAEELHTFLDAVGASAPQWYPLFSTLALTAMRVGEATALRWDDVDEAAGVIHVRRGQWRGVIGTTKTGTARTVPLPPRLAAVLRDHRRALVAAQHPGLASGWVFPAARRRKTREGEAWPPVNTTSLRKPLLDALAQAELKGRITTHGLRRTWNNLLRQVTAGEVVRAITGHVTERMTEHYSHVGRDEKANAAARALSLVRKPPAEVGTSVGTEATETNRPEEAVSFNRP